ncbi:RNA-directed DNA polymerase, eukaryota, reverse transcriptase zinc-binding domain protein [Tanacetum coccineum]
MRNQRQSRVPLRFEDNVHNINNSKTNKKKIGSKNKSFNKKEHETFKESSEGDRESRLSKEANREDGVEISNTEENVGNNDLNDEETIKEKSINSDDIQNNLDSVLSNEGIEGVFGTADNEEHSDTKLDCDISQSPMQGNNGNNMDQMRSSYASMVKSYEVPWELDFIPTVITENGNKVVVFDEELVMKGSTISEECGGRYGIAEIDKWKNGCYMFKFKDEKGMNAVIEKGPWMINNVPLEAWCVKGISALASGLGKPMLMDTMTTNMCHKGIGNLSYARVLVEMDVAKELKTEIEIQYIDKGKHIKGSKKGGAEMNDKAGTITDEKVNDNNGKGKGIQQESANIKEHGQWKIYRNENNRNGGYSNYKNNFQNQRQNNGPWRMGRPENHKKEYRKKQNVTELNEKNKEYSNQWKVGDEVVREIRNSVNKYSPTIKESITWSKDMIEYFKAKWDEDRLKESNDGNDTGEIEDILEPNEGTAKVMRDTEECNKGCRIFVRWDTDDTNIQVLHKTSQSIFCVISATNCDFKCFYTFMYAANDGINRRKLWEEIVKDSRYVNGNPWCIAGDLNVTLHLNEHSCGSSIMSTNMLDFQECLNNIKVEDICRSGLHFTWTKNLQKTKAGNMTEILKKLNRVMSNEAFINKFPNAHAKFLPYLISDHTPSILCIPTTFRKKRKAFRFSNFLTDKQELLPIVSEKWMINIHGYYIYQVVQKLKSLKRPLNKLGWCKGNIFKRVKYIKKSTSRSAN